jgi:alpha-glucoside transport system substrate-binding protein
MKRVGNLYSSITKFNNLLLAAKKAQRCKRLSKYSTYKPMFHTKFRWFATRFLTVLLTGLLAIVLGSCRASLRTSAPDPQSLTLMGTITGKGIQDIQQTIAPFSDRSGIRITYQGTDALTTLLPLQIAAGNPPDLALFPQPGLMGDLVAEQALIPLESLVDPQLLDNALTPQWRFLGKIGEHTYGLPVRAYLKGLVWYVPQRFAEKGYEVPQSWAELEALTQQIIADGETPWCLGVESGEASGWVGTDWVEDILLRQSGEETYDRWVTHAIPFTDPAVANAFATFGHLVLNPKAVLGGKVGILSTNYGDAPLGLFQDPPGCYLHTQANFIPAFFPEEVNREAVDFFPLPGFTRAADASRLVVGAVQLGVLRDTPAVRSFLEYWLTPEPHKIWAGLGEHLSPYRDVAITDYPDRLSQKEAEILKSADILRFDASDAMPSAVGTGSFWAGMVDYLSGVELNTVLKDIDASWPRS